MKAKDRRAVMAQLGCCLEEARMEISRVTGCEPEESKVYLLDMLKEKVSIIEEDKSLLRVWRWMFYRKS